MKLFENNKRISFGNLITILAAILVFSLMLTSCAGSKAASTQAAGNAVAPAADMDYKSKGFDGEAEAAPTPVPSVAAVEGGFGDNVGLTFSEEALSQSVIDQRKIIMDGNVSIETFDFDASIQAMDRLIESFGGFAENRTVRGKSSQSRALRDASYTIRVPAESFEKVLKDMGTIGNVLESNSKGTDITDQYTDSQTRVKTLKVQEQTLLEIMEKATKLEDVITLESRISEVRYEIERIENTLRNFDRLMAFSRITVYIQEVDEVTDTKPVARTLGERVSSSFTESIENFRFGLEDFLVWLAGAWISLIFLAIMAIMILVYMKSRKKKKPQAQNTQSVQPVEIKKENKE